MRIERLDPSEWKKTVPKEGLYPFHTSEKLGVLNQHTAGEVNLLDGSKPERPVGFETRPAFTYRINLNDRNNKELLNSFARSLRRTIRKREDVDISIRKGDINGAKRTYESITERYRESNGSAMSVAKGIYRMKEVRKDLLGRKGEL